MVSVQERRRFLRHSLGLLLGGGAGLSTGRAALALPQSAGAAVDGPERRVSAPESIPIPPKVAAPPTAGLSDSEPPSLEPVEVIPAERSGGSGNLGIPTPYLAGRTLLTAYGRSFGVAPILGLLGGLRSFDELETTMAPWVESIHAITRAPVTLAPHLIYALARGCGGGDDACLIFLDASRVDIIREYILPALERDMAVVLDAQMGRMSAVSIIQRMIDSGYLSYPNVHVALDPEFVTGRLQGRPGDPIGRLPADQINSAQELLSTYVRDERLRTAKVLIIHQFIDETTNTWTMIPNKDDLQRFPSVELVMDADGFGSPDQKVFKYNGITDLATYPNLDLRGIKVFQRNPVAPRFSDTPVMTARQLFGLDPTSGGRYMWAPPHVVIVA